jgi:hypothetical protein
MRKLIAVASLGVLGFVGLAACGGGSDGIEGVDVKDGGKSVEIKSNDGKDTFTVGDDAEVPDDFPSDVPLPEGGKVGVVADGETNGKQYFHVTYVLKPKDVESSFDDYKDALESAGFDLGDSANYSGDGGVFGSIHATSADWDVTAIKVASDGDGNGGISIQVTQT